ncbi:MAG TPA: TetR/AcrR family transcriptional regulator [Anaerolineales bacterium]|nr:TetR/AcrR family transcriptional regulator [Anaerolineales bacterium]
MDVAGDLFFRSGYRAVGVDTIVERTGLAKMTLYRHFPSKDDLIVAYLEQVNRLFWEWFEAAADSAGAKPRERLLAVFTALERLVASPKCHGCAFLMASSEFPELDSPGHRVALAHKRNVRDRFRAEAAKAGATDPGGLADGLLLLMDGAFASARMFGTRNPGGHVSASAQALIDSHSDRPVKKRAR